MSNITTTEKIKIENMIYEVREKHVMLDSEISRIKFYYYLLDKIITHYDISKTISVFNNFIIGVK